MTAHPSESAKQEWKSGWNLVLAAAAGMSVSPLLMYTMGIFIRPLEQEFGWSRAAITSGFSVYAAISIILSSFGGMLIDHVGPRRVAIIGVGGFVLTFALLAANNGTLVQWWAHWFMISFAAVLVKPTVWVSAVTSRFERARGMAIALTLSGSSISAIVGPIFGGWMIEHYGWRMAYLGIAAVWAFISLPLLIAYFYGAADFNRTRKASAAKPIDRSTLPGAGAKEAMLSANYIKLTLACVMSYFAIIGSIVNLVPMISVDGMAPAEAASLVGALGVASFGGRILAGYWLDHFSAKAFGVAIFCLPAIACLILFYAEMNWVNALVVVLMFGVAAGVEFEVASFLTARYFGMRNFGLLFGTIVGLLGISSGLAPVTFGHIYDQFGNYDLAIKIALPLSILASLLIASLDRDPSPRGEPVPAH